MATSSSFWFARDLTADLIDDFFNIADQASQSRETEHNAAITIQSFVRGCQSRARIQEWNNSAVQIQKIYRAEQGRKRAEMEKSRQLAEQVERSRHQLATKIQAVFRGFLARKHEMDFYRRKSYLGSVNNMGNAMRDILAEHYESQAAREEAEEDDRQREQFMRQSLRNHHLIGTRANPGVMNKDDLDSSVKTVMKTAAPALVASQRRNRAQQKRPNPSRIQPLSNRPTVKGPFKSPDEVDYIVNRKPNPSIRSSVPYETVNEAKSLDRRHNEASRISSTPFRASRGTPLRSVAPLAASEPYSSVPVVYRTSTRPLSASKPAFVATSRGRGTFDKDRM